MQRFLTILWRGKLCALLAATVAITAFSVSDQRATAQAEAKSLKLLFTDNPKELTNPRTNLRLRPNILQEFFVYVENTSDKALDATVQVAVRGVPVDGFSQKVKVDANKTVRVSFAKAAAPAPAPAPAPEKPAAPGAPPAEKGPQLVDLSGPPQIRILDDKDKVIAETEVRVGRPDEYIEVTNILFNPKLNKMTVTLKAKPEFSGPRSRVELVLRPDRIPALTLNQKKDGSYAGYLSRPNDTLVLEADNLKLNEGGDRNGLVYLTIDGYERAYTFHSTFSGDQISEPRRIDGPILRLNAARATVPGTPSKVHLEMDNTPPESAAELGLYRSDKSNALDGELLKFTSDRDVRFAISPNGPNGGILFKATVSDWAPNLDTAGLYGGRALRLRLMGKDKEIEFINSAKPILIDGTVQRTNEITVGLVLDATKPERIRFLTFPAKLDRGAFLPVQATAVDPESGISEVVFFGGKLQPDGNPPANATPVPGKQIGKDTWAAQLPVATDKKGQVDVTVQFTNGAGLKATDTVVIQLVDPPAEGARPKGGIIEGTVYEGDRVQPNLRVWLFDEKSLARDSVITDSKGYYIFKEVIPGPYRVVAVKSGSNTRAENSAQVMEGQRRSGLDLKMVRP